MSFRGARRGQALQIGAVLLFASLVVALAVYQAAIVPQENAEVEFDAYRGAIEDVSQLRSGVLAAGGQGVQSGTTVATGTTYPARALFVNPPPASGRLRSTPPESVVISNATAVGEDSRDYWNGSARAFETRRLVFRPGYSEIDVPPAVATGAVAYRPTGNGAVGVGPQSLVRGNRITLVSIAGELNETGVSTGVTVEPVSAATRTVIVRPTGDPDGDGDPELKLTLPTELSNETWADALSGEPAVEAVLQNGSAVDVLLEGGRTYELVLAKVEVRGQNDAGAVDEPDAHYAVARAGDGAAITTDQTVELVAEVRDRYDNPRPGVTVEFVSDGSVIGTATTGEDGTASVRFSPDDAGDYTVVARFGGSRAPLNRTEFSVSVGTGADSGGTGTDSVGQGATAEWSPDDTSATISSDGGLWKNLTGVQRLLVSDPRFAPTEARGSQPTEKTRYFRIVFAVTDGSRTYYLSMTNAGEGLAYRTDKPNNPWKNIRLDVIKEDGGDFVESHEIKLNETALDAWYGPTATTSEPLNLLEPGAYRSNSAAGFRELLTEIKQLLRSGTADVFVAEMHGRTALNATVVGQPLAYPDEFRDDDGSTEPQENASLEPPPTDGDVGQFGGLQQPQSNGIVETTSALSLSERNLTTTATYGVENASEYTLETEFTVDMGSADDVELRIVAANGTVLQSADLNGSVELNDRAADYVRRTGNLYVAWTQVGGTDLRVLIDYQRLRGG